MTQSREFIVGPGPRPQPGTREVCRVADDTVDMDLLAASLSLDAQTDGFILHDLYLEDGGCWAEIEWTDAP